MADVAALTVPIGQSEHFLVAGSTLRISPLLHQGCRRVSPAYTLYVPNSWYLDERKYASYAAAKCQTPLREVNTTDCWYLSSKWLSASAFDQPEQPGAAASLLATVSRARTDGIGILLGGEGGDEWLSGGTWTSHDRSLAATLLSGRVRTAGRIARVHAAGRPTPATLGVAVLDGLLPSPVLSQLRRLKGHPQTCVTFVDWKATGSR